ncbi:MAG: sulfatase-like hydrolase/transferase [Faecalibacterium sp.]
MKTSKKPNILFLMSDEHRADVTGYAGNKIVRTPTLDALAASGTVFTNCYTPSPICIPGRQAMMMGQNCKHCGCREYGNDLPPFSNTFAKWLSRYGYQTVCCGKLHHTGPDQMQGWTKRVSGDIQMNAPYIETEEGCAPFVAEWGKWSDAKEIMKAGASDAKNNDDYVVEGALQFIKNYFIDPDYDRPCKEQPLLLKVSLLKPHYPYFTKQKQFDYYLNRVQPYLEEAVFDHPFLSTRQVKANGDLTNRDITRATAAYYGMIEEIDTQYAAVLQALEDAGQNLDDWLIIYTSDHGEMLGEHGIWEKQKFFEASVRVPLIIRAPKARGANAVHKNVNTTDLYATLCDYVGIPTPPDLDSHSLAPLMADANAPWDNMTISHFGRHDGGNHLMIKQDDLKYQYYGKDMPEVLFDLAKDPSECTNFATDPAYAENMAVFRAMVPQYQY